MVDPGNPVWASAMTGARTKAAVSIVVTARFMSILLGKCGSITSRLLNARAVAHAAQPTPAPRCIAIILLLSFLGKARKQEVPGGKKCS
jgi:hypothetical protein